MVDHATIDHSGIPGVGAAIDTGTSFPGSPSSNDLFYRTDRDLLYFYDGTRWLTVNLYSQPLVAGDTPVPATATGTTSRGHCAFAGVYDLWLEDYQATFFVNGGTALGASHKWVSQLKKNPATTVIATINIDSGASSVWRDSGPVAIDALLGTTQFGFDAFATKTGTPGTLFFLPYITYRVVG